jgi:hypothetical protein
LLQLSLVSARGGERKGKYLPHLELILLNPISFPTLLREMLLACVHVNTVLYHTELYMSLDGVFATAVSFYVAEAKGSKSRSQDALSFVRQRQC